MDHLDNGHPILHISAKQYSSPRESITEDEQNHSYIADGGWGDKQLKAWDRTEYLEKWAKCSVEWFWWLWGYRDSKVERVKAQEESGQKSEIQTFKC